MKYKEIDPENATKEELAAHKDFMNYVDTEGRILANIENMKYYLANELNINDMLSFRSCINNFTTIFGTLVIHSIDGNMPAYYDAVVDMNKFKEKFEKHMEMLEEMAKEESKKNIKETLN